MWKGTLQAASRVVVNHSLACSRLCRQQGTYACCRVAAPVVRLRAGTGRQEVGPSETSRLAGSTVGLALQADRAHLLQLGHLFGQALAAPLENRDIVPVPLAPLGCGSRRERTVSAAANTCADTSTRDGIVGSCCQGQPDSLDCSSGE